MSLSFIAKLRLLEQEQVQMVLLAVDRILLKGEVQDVPLMPQTCRVWSGTMSWKAENGSNHPKEFYYSFHLAILTYDCIFSNGSHCLCPQVPSFLCPWKQVVHIWKSLEHGAREAASTEDLDFRVTRACAFTGVVVFFFYL